MTKYRKPTEQEIKSFWEWCGLKHLQKGSHDKFHHLEAIRYPDNSIYSVWPPITLDNLFKWAVPIGIEVVLSYIEGADVTDDCKYYCEFKGNGECFGAGWGDTYALALFWALKRVQEKEETDVNRCPQTICLGDG